MRYIAIDLDDTLLDTSAIKECIFQRLQAHGVPRSVLVRTYKALTRGAAYTPAAHIDSLRSQGYMHNIGYLTSRVEEIFKSPRRFNFVGVEAFVRQLRKRGYRLVLLTYGNREFQLRKFRQSKLERYFTQIHLARQKNKKEALEKLQRVTENNLIVVDNSAGVIKTVLELKIAALRIKQLNTSPPDYDSLLSCLAAKDTACRLW